MMNLGIYRNPKPSSVSLPTLTEYDGKPADLTDLLPWGFFLAPGLIVNKVGS